MHTRVTAYCSINSSEWFAPRHHKRVKRSWPRERKIARNDQRMQRKSKAVHVKAARTRLT